MPGSTAPTCSSASAATRPRPAPRPRSPASRSPARSSRRGQATRPLLGRPVCALVAGGGYAQYCLAQADHCLPVPPGLAPAEAASLPETLFTVWHNVFQRGCRGGRNAAGPRRNQRHRHHGDQTRQAVPPDGDRDVRERGQVRRRARDRRRPRDRLPDRGFRRTGHGAHRRQGRRAVCLDMVAGSYPSATSTASPRTAGWWPSLCSAGPRRRSTWRA